MLKWLFNSYSVENKQEVETKNRRINRSEQDIREEGDEKLLLLIAFNLPFDDVTYVHHYQEKKENVFVMRKIKESTLQLYIIWIPFRQTGKTQAKLI